MSEIRCERCRNKLEGKNYFTYCSVKKEFVCLRCECQCENYSAELLRNGTHCKQSYYNEEYKYILLSMSIAAPEYDVVGAIGKYKHIQYGELYNKFKTQVCLYEYIPPDERERKARARVELAAMQQVLRERELSNPKLSTWARRFFNKVGD